MKRFSSLLASGIVVASTLFFGTAFAGNLDNIVTYLKMENITSGTVLDYSGQHNAVVSGNPTLVPGRVGMALQFDGIVDHLKLPALPLADHDKITVEYWLKTSDLSKEYQLCGFTTLLVVPAYSIRIGASYDGLFANPGTVMDWYSGLPHITAGQWHHIALTIDAGDRAVIYIDGVEKYQIFSGVASTLADIPFFGVGATLDLSPSSPLYYSQAHNYR